MANHIHRPPIHEKTVEVALDAMRRGSPLPGDNPLRFLLTIQERLDSPSRPSGDIAVQVAVFDWLSQAVTERLSEIRQLYRLHSPGRSSIGDGLLADFQQQNRELEAWSVLYHRYVCVDRDYTMQSLAAQTNHELRTLRRRHRLGITRLTRLLVEQETHTREQETRKRLLLALPRVFGPPLFGADSLLSLAQHILSTAGHPHHILFHGPLGIGKTSLALELCRRVIDTSQYEDLLWLELSELTLTADVVRAEIFMRLGLPFQHGMSFEKSLRAYLFSHPTLIVLDGADQLLQNDQLTQQVLDTLDSATIVLTSRISSSPSVMLHHIPIPSMKKESAARLLEYLASKTSSPGDWLENFDTIWESVGGNPLALIVSMHLSWHVPPSAFSLQTDIDRLYREMWNGLAETSRRLLLIPLLCTRDTVPYQMFGRLTGLSARKVNEGLQDLCNLALLFAHRESDGYYFDVQPITRTFLWHNVQGELALSDDQTIAEYLQVVLDQQVDHVSDAHHAMVLLKLANRIGVPSSRQWMYAYTLAPKVLGCGLWQSWTEVLLSLLDTSLSGYRQAWINHMIGSAFRWMGELERSRDYLLRSLEGSADDTVFRADTLLELSVIFRYSGELNRAHQTAQRALEILLLAKKDEEKIERAFHELAQISLDTNHPDEGLDWLSQLRKWSARTWGVASEVYLRLGRFHNALQAAEQSRRMLPANHPHQGRVLAILGRAYDALGDIEAAIDHILLATELLHREKDTVGYARACNNLAVAYLHQSKAHPVVESDTVYRLLVRSLGIQERIGDEVGRAITQENLDWFKRTFPGISNGH